MINMKPHLPVIKSTNLLRIKQICCFLGSRLRNSEVVYSFKGFKHTHIHTIIDFGHFHNERAPREKLHWSKSTFTQEQRAWDGLINTELSRFTVWLSGRTCWNKFQWKHFNGNFQVLEVILKFSETFIHTKVFLCKLSPVTSRRFDRYECSRRWETYNNCRLTPGLNTGWLTTG